MAPTKPYSGPLRRLVLAFDVGTTYSGVAYTVLDPGEVPKVQAVTRYPGQENGDFKIPSILYYTPEGNVRAVGAEAASPALRLEAEDDDLVFVEWFKLHLRPSSMIEGISQESMPKLPPGKTAVDVFADFLAYLFSCARRYITQTHANGESLWQSVGSRIDFVLGHPNGWEGVQQSRMREAALLGGLIDNASADYSRIHFVTEGEASLHYCLDGGLASDIIENGSSVMIIDAGGGTVDLSTYTFTSVSPITVEEIATPDCILQGSTRVNVRAREFFQEKLRNSKYGNDEDIDSMVEHFDKSTKPTFKDPKERSYVKFGSMRDKDPAVGIKGGQLQLAGKEVETLFQPSVDAIIDAVYKQYNPASKDVTTAFLVGGFAASPWLFRRLQESLRDNAIYLCRPDHSTNKAVAEGAASFFLEKFVSTRIAKLTYGTEVCVDFDASNPDHRLRRGRITMQPSGRKVIPEAFSVLLPKGKRVRDNEEVTIRLVEETWENVSSGLISCDLTCYRGKKDNPCWIDLEPEMFPSLCTLYADLSGVAKKRHIGKKGVYYTQGYTLVLLCGLTEMSAQLRWLENGIEKRGPAEIVYDDVVERV